jgi:uncharacterized protein
MGNPIVHFEVMGTDGAALRKFYGDLFGWQIDELEGMDYGLVDTGTAPAGGIGANANNPTGYVTVYVEVDDLEPALEQAKSLGATIAVEPMEIPGDRRIALFTDPEGHLIGMVSGSQ